MHRRASQWYEDNHFPDNAINHALEAKDWERAIKIIKEQYTNKLHNGEYVTLHNWLQKIPEEVIYRNLDLCNAYSIVLITFSQFDAADSFINHIEKAGKSDNITLQGDIASLRSMIAYWRGDLDQALELGEKALLILTPDNTDRRSDLFMMMGFNYWQRGRFKEAEPLLTKAVEVGRKSGDYLYTANALSLLGDMYTVRGKLRRAFELHQQAIELAGSFPSAAVSHGSLSALYYEWNDLEAAVHHVQQAIDLSQLMGGQGLPPRLNAMLARYRLAQGDEAGAMKALEKACLIAHNSGSPDMRVEHAAFHILLALEVIYK